MSSNPYEVNNAATGNALDTYFAGSQDFYKFWQEMSGITKPMIGTIVEVKTLGQTIKNVDTKNALEAQTLISAEEIPIYAADVLTRDGRRYNNCQIMYPYSHSNPNLGGAGIYFVPEEGSEVIVMHIMGEPFIMGFISSVDLEEGGFRNSKEPVFKGSYVLKTSSGNKIIMRKGGIILIHSTPACQRQYIPLRDQIRDLCKNYFLTTSGGQLQWTLDPITGRFTNMRWSLFDQPISVDSAPNGVVLDIGMDPDFPEKHLFNLDWNGAAKLHVTRDGFIDLDTNVKIIDDPSVEGQSAATPESGSIDIDAEEDIELTPGKTLRLGTSPTSLHKLSIPDYGKFPPRTEVLPEPSFGGSIGKTTESVFITCDIDMTTRIGNNKIQHIENDENNVTDGVRADHVKGNERFEVGGSHIQTGAPIHLNPAASGSMALVTAIPSAGKLTLATVGLGALSDTVDVSVFLPQAFNTEVLNTLDLQNLIDTTITSTPVPFTGGFTNTVNSVIGTSIGPDVILGEPTTFSLNNVTNGILTLVENSDFMQSNKSGITLLNSSAILAHIDNGGTALATTLEVTTPEFDIFQGAGVSSGAVDGTYPIPDFVGENLIFKSGQLIAPLITPGVFAFDDQSSTVVRDLDLSGARSLELRLSGPNNFPYTDPVSGAPVTDTVFRDIDGFVATP